MASKRRLRRRSCTSKQRHTKDEAYGALRSMSKRGRINQVTNVYKCTFCNGYHIGRTSQKQQQAKRDSMQWRG